MKTYYNPQAQIGSLVSGEFLKEMIGRGWIGFEGAVIDGAHYSNDALSVSDIEDNETYIIALNTNSNEVEAIMLFTERRIAIKTGMKPEGAIGEDGLPLTMEAQ